MIYTILSRVIDFIRRCAVFFGKEKKSAGHDTRIDPMVRLEKIIHWHRAKSNPEGRKVRPTVSGVQRVNARIEFYSLDGFTLKRREEDLPVFYLPVSHMLLIGGGDTAIIMKVTSVRGNVDDEPTRVRFFREFVKSPGIHDIDVYSEHFMSINYFYLTYPSMFSTRNRLCYGLTSWHWNQSKGTRITTLVRVIQRYVRCHLFGKRARWKRREVMLLYRSGETESRLAALPIELITNHIIWRIN